MSEFKIPTEVVELPSKGLIYSEDNPLSSGKVEIKYMTAREEDILTNKSYIENNTTMDKLLESVVVSNINLDDLVLGDKDALLVSTRILGYGKDYSFYRNNEEVNVDLSTLENAKFDESLITKGKNEFEFELPHSSNKITFKLLTVKDTKEIDKELKGLNKVNKNFSPELSTRLKYIITSINGEEDKKTIREFVDKALLARDSRALRNHINKVKPKVDLTYQLDSGEETAIPIGVGFFWPDTV